VPGRGQQVGSAPEKRVRRTDFTAAEHRKNPNGTLKRDVAGQKMAFFNGLLENAVLSVRPGHLPAVSI
jgi:hypothetical protein